MTNLNEWSQLCAVALLTTTVLLSCLVPLAYHLYRAKKKNQE